MSGEVVHVAPVKGGASLLLAWRVKAQVVLIVGGGAVATGRVRRALEADGEVVVVAPEITTELRIRHERNEITWHQRSFETTDLDNAAMVMTAIDDAETSIAIYDEAKRRNIPVNVADVPHACDFWFTSVHRRGPIQVAVSSNGQGPALAARLTKEIGHDLSEELEDAVERFFVLRKAVRQAAPGPENSAKRMTWLTEVGRTWSYADLSSLSDEDVSRLVQDFLHGRPARTSADAPVEAKAQAGSVTLVGAGPGDPDLLTVAATKALASADIVFADRLIPPAVLQLVKGRLRYARKLPGRSEQAQKEMDQEVLAAAQSGLHVVRLKQGDPLIFGRGGEEMLFFAEHGVETEIIPGLSSALSGPLLAGVPPTHRGLANRLVIMTGQTQGGGWPVVPAFDAQTTVVMLMAVGRAEQLAQQMIDKGYPAHWPAMVVERAGQPEQQSVTTTLTQLGTDIVHHALRAPAIIVVGRVAEFPQHLASFGGLQPAAVGGEA